MSFTHSIMFHHFHNDKHLPAQGSLSETDFEEMLDWLDKKYNLIGANNYLQKLKTNSLSNEDICLSFDDALLCQYDIALPFLRNRNLDAFFFIYSSAFIRDPINFEIFRHFRTNCFDGLEDFYHCFFDIVKSKHRAKFENHRKFYNKIDYLKDFRFYSDNDK
jgi:hypothetical protein